MPHSRQRISSVTHPTLKRTARNAKSLHDFINTEEFYFPIDNSLCKFEIHWRHDHISAF